MPLVADRLISLALPVRQRARVLLPETPREGAPSKSAPLL
jgi:hypothetical protein